MGKNKIVILGGGLSGSIMHSVLDFDSKVIERSRSSDHKAILRFRDPKIGMYLNITLDDVVVRKAIYYKGEFFNEPNIFFSNSYSLKTIGSLEQRSIGDLSSQKRWMMRGECFNSKIVNDLNSIVGYEVFDISKGVIKCKDDTGDIKEVEYDQIISTIPIEFLIKNCINSDICEGVEFLSSPIYVYSDELSEGFSGVCQTIYFPDLDFPVYRASIDHKRIIIEAISECEEVVLSEVINSFGLKNFKFELKKNIQKFGKIKPLVSDIRKEILFQLTNQYNIYSLGRFAIWDNIKSDEILKDALKIKKMLSLSENHRNYFIKKESSDEDRID